MIRGSTVKEKIFQRTVGITAMGIFLFCQTLELSAQNKKWVVPEDVASKVNPIELNDEVLKRGKVLYTQFCVMCHGTTGVVEGNMATMNPAPTDLTTDTFQDQTDGTLFYKIRTGKPPKPSFEKHINEEDTWKLLHYLRTLKADKKD